MNIYDRQGKAISAEEWGALSKTLKRVAHTTLPDGKLVSTVWLGLDHNFSGEGRPLIFETMVFTEEWFSVDVVRYSTEEEAIAGHEDMVKKWSKVE